MLLDDYDHLTRVLMKVMDERPENAVDVIEDLSQEVKRSECEISQTTLQNLPQPTAADSLVEPQRLLYSHGDEVDQEDELVDALLPHVNETGFYLEQAGVGFGREELQRISLALKQLVESQLLQRCRLWGKILGMESSYIVAEAESKEAEEDVEQNTEELAEEESEGDAQRNEIDPLPQSTYKPPLIVPKEAPGTGANTFVYYVCKEPGLPWVKLPSVTPAQIRASRQIYKFFTGNLDAPVVSYPPFPGNEANYLRSQIARISAGTQVSPHGFFHFMQEEGVEEDEAPSDSYEVNPDFEGIPAVEMTESLATWVHHVQHILQQGRCTWTNPALIPGEKPNEEEEAEDMNEVVEDPDVEVGPPLLTSLLQDTDLFDTPPWSSKMSSTLIPQHAIAVLRSNLWPGACAYACGKKFENIYIGWGVKFSGEGYDPPVPPPPQQQHASGPETSESLDPTVEEEQALREALEEKHAAEEEMYDTEEEDDD
ncbi:radial spoke head protein 4 homolog A-like isoform X2 [Thalassophryne amazonica]|uniref:radial spoke head protein 4 homolog A-like isoform X2 n=1 Tax=Thalassophryne amazonica TaxID=390379 RepID=UPI0014722B4B|nr:radial spoke head protein 4 homolog A-like isoform X2 [Thalassophryne amazonica]